MNIQRDTYPTRGSESEARPQWAMPTLNQTASAFKNTTFIAGTDFTIPAGSANAIVTIQLPFAPIVGTQGRTAIPNTTTLVLGGALATTLTTEIPFSGLDGGGPNTALLVLAGQFMVDYETGTLTGKRVDTGTTGTVAYSYWVPSSDLNIASITVGSNLTQINGATVTAGINAPSTSQSGTQDVLPYAVYNATPTVRTEAQAGVLQANTAGALNVDETMAAQAENNTDGVFAEAIKPLATSTYSWTLFQNLGANSTLNVKSSAGSIKSVYCHNIGASPAYIQIHKTSTTPAGGAVPALTWLLPAGGVTQIDGQVLGENGYFCATGIAFGFSSTESTYTAGTAANQVTQIMWI